MARRVANSVVEPAIRFHLFLERARRIGSHPLAIRNADTGTKMKLSINVDGTPSRIDFLNADAPQWKELASMVRPIAFLQDEPVSINGVLNLVAQLDVTSRGRVAEAKAGLLSWRNSTYWAVQVSEVPDGVAAGTPGEPELVAVSMVPAGPPPPSRFLSSDQPWVTDAQLANIYFQGELWHSDHEAALKLVEGSMFMLKEYEKAAEVRTRHVVPFILNAASIVEAGIQEGRLPRYEPKP